MTVTYYFEPYMAPIGLLLFFLKHYLITRSVVRTEYNYQTDKTLYFPDILVLNNFQWLRTST